MPQPPSVTEMTTQVAIIGGGPAGLLLSQILNRAGIATVILERQSRDHVLSRIRAGVLEWGTVEMLRQAGVGSRMDTEGLVHDGTFISAGETAFRIDFHALTGKRVMIYGQTEVTRDLYAAQDQRGTPIVHGVEAVSIHGVDGTRPEVHYSLNGVGHRLRCDFVAGCDGFHGVSRRTIPDNVRQEFERVYPFGWLGVLARTPPVSHELIYSGHERGFALASMRNPMLTRYYIQVPLSDTPAQWSDQAFWDELRRRLPRAAAEALVTGPSIEKSIAPLRSFVSEPMRWGRLFLCGDSSHIVPPTGAKGLNLAVSDVYYLSSALTRHYHHRDDSGLEGYSAKALARVWQAIRFSWSMTTLLHRFPDATPFEQRIQRAELAALEQSPSAQRVLAENYIGLPF